jgi:hypothetical protein
MLETCFASQRDHPNTCPCAPQLAAYEAAVEDMRRENAPEHFIHNVRPPSLGCPPSRGCYS